MAIVIKGVVKNGKVELDDPSGAIDGTKVLVTLPEDARSPEHGQRIYFGMFRRWGDITEQDIDVAQYSAGKFLRNDGEK